MERSYQRNNDELRPLRITRGFTKNAAGSVLIEAGDTHVLCTASVDDRVPFHVRGKNQGWLTGEYSMLPGSTLTRSPREAARGRQGGRTLEIQRLIGRSLRACIDLRLLGERTIVVDCDVLQADGGTRCASITGGFVALMDAVNFLIETEKISENPIHTYIGSVSVGIVKNQILLDLDYSEDKIAQTDMNFVMDERGDIVEVQGTAEQTMFSIDQLSEMAMIARKGIQAIVAYQKEVIEA